MTGIRVFQLLELLAAGKSARARLLNWNGERYRPSAFAAIQVYDVLGEHGERGDCGYCFMSDESHRWEVLGCGLSRVRNEAVREAPGDCEEGPNYVGTAPYLPTLRSVKSQDWPLSNGR